MLSKTSASANAAIGKLTGTVTSTTTRIDNSLESLQATIDHNSAVIERLQILANDTSTGSEDADALIASTINSLREQNQKLQSIKDGLCTVERHGKRRYGNLEREQRTQRGN